MWNLHRPKESFRLVQQETLSLVFFAQLLLPVRVVGEKYFDPVLSLSLHPIDKRDSRSASNTASGAICFWSSRQDHPLKGFICTLSLPYFLSNSGLRNSVIQSFLVITSRFSLAQP